MDIVMTVKNIIDLTQAAGRFSLSITNLLMIILAGYIIGICCLTITYTLYSQNKEWRQTTIFEKTVLSFITGILLLAVSTLTITILEVTVWEKIRPIIPLILYSGPFILYLSLFRYNRALVSQKLEYIKRIIHILSFIIIIFIAVNLFLLLFLSEAYLALFSTLAIFVFIYIATLIHTHIVK